jgi:hypothetical protein
VRCVHANECVRTCAHVCARAMLGCVHVCQGGQRYVRAGLCVCVCIVQQVKRELDARPVQVAAGAPSEAIKVDGFVHAAMATTATATGLLPFNEMRLLSAKVASATHRPPPAVRAMDMACLPSVSCVPRVLHSLRQMGSHQ